MDSRGTPSATKAPVRAASESSSVPSRSKMGTSILEQPPPGNAVAPVAHLRALGSRTLTPRAFFAACVAKTATWLAKKPLGLRVFVPGAGEGTIYSGVTSRPYHLALNDEEPPGPPSSEKPWGEPASPLRAPDRPDTAGRPGSVPHMPLG